MSNKNNIRTLPSAFPLHEKQHYISEREWVIWSLLCRPLSSLPQSSPEDLCAATGGQISVSRCDELIRIANIASLTGIGTWIARLLAESGFSANDVCDKPAEVLLGKINTRLGYPLCNEATMHALTQLQLQWRNEEAEAMIKSSDTQTASA